MTDRMPHPRHLCQPVRPDSHHKRQGRNEWFRPCPRRAETPSVDLTPHPPLSEQPVHGRRPDVPELSDLDTPLKIAAQSFQPHFIIVNTPQPAGVLQANIGHLPSVFGCFRRHVCIGIYPCHPVPQAHPIRDGDRGRSGDYVNLPSSPGRGKDGEPPPWRGGVRGAPETVTPRTSGVTGAYRREADGETRCRP